MLSYADMPVSYYTVSFNAVHIGRARYIFKVLDVMEKLDNVAKNTTGYILFSGNQGKMVVFNLMYKKIETSHERSQRR